MNADDHNLQALLLTLDSKTRNDLRRVLIRDQADRDAIAARLLKYRDERGTAWADLVDRLTLDPELRRRYVRLLGELEASP